MKIIEAARRSGKSVGFWYDRARRKKYARVFDKESGQLRFEISETQYQAAIDAKGYETRKPARVPTRLTLYLNDDLLKKLKRRGGTLNDAALLLIERGLICER